MSDTTTIPPVVAAMIDRVRRERRGRDVGPGQITPLKQRFIDRAFEQGAHIVWVGPGDENYENSAAQPHTNTVFVGWGAEQNDRERFWVAMHELGHLATIPPFFIKSWAGSAEIAHLEAAAWEWAVDNAGIPVDDVARASIGASLSTYLFFGIGEATFPSDDETIRRMIMLAGPSPVWSAAESWNDVDSQRMLDMAKAEWPRLYAEFA